MSHTGQWIEVQIRSQRMDEMAEQGFAAHWKYKEGGKTSEDSENELDKWLHTIKEILDDPQPNAIDFLDTIKLNLYASEIFVVTPKGEFKTMPADSTVLDFAFTIHTFLGTHCIGAKVNHKLEPISYVLQSGDQVEILTSKSQKVAPEWMNFVTTAKAKGKIQAVLRREEREKQKQGEELLNAFLREHDMDASSVSIDRLRCFHNLSTRDDLLLALGGGVITLGDADVAVLKGENPGRTVWSKYLTFFMRHHDDNEEAKPQEEPVPLVIDKKKPLILNEETIGRYTICD